MVLKMLAVCIVSFWFSLANGADDGNNYNLPPSSPDWDAFLSGEELPADRHYGQPLFEPSLYEQVFQTDLLHEQPQELPQGVPNHPTTSINHPEIPEASASTSSIKINPLLSDSDIHNTGPLLDNRNYNSYSGYVDHSMYPNQFQNYQQLQQGLQVSLNPPTQTFDHSPYQLDSNLVLQAEYGKTPLHGGQLGFIGQSSGYYEEQQSQIPNYPSVARTETSQLFESDSSSHLGQYSCSNTGSELTAYVEQVLTGKSPVFPGRTPNQFDTSSADVYYGSSEPNPTPLSDVNYDLSSLNPLFPQNTYGANPVNYSSQEGLINYGQGLQYPYTSHLNTRDSTSWYDQTGSENPNPIPDQTELPDISIIEPAEYYANVAGSSSDIESNRKSKRLRKSEGGCNFQMSDLPNNHSIIMNKYKGEVLYPSKEGMIEVREGSTIHIHCIHGHLQNIPGRIKDLVLVCEKNGSFTNERRRNEIVNVKDFECSSIPTAAVHKVKVSKVCLPFVHYQVGYFVEGKMIKVFDLCAVLNEKGKLPEVIYVKKTLDNSLKASEDFGDLGENIRNLDSVLFKVTDTFNNEITDRHMQCFLQRQISSSDNKIYQQMVHNNEEEYHLTKGLLLSKLDLVYRSEKLMAFLWVNVKPMWSHLKENNWKNVELAIHALATERQTPFDLYVGAFEHFQAQDLNGNPFPRDLYAARDHKMGHVLRIPNIFYKILHDSATGECVAIIGHNTTYPVFHTDVICPGDFVTDEIEWLKGYLDRQNPSAGIAYACRCQQIADGQVALIQVGRMKITGGVGLVVTDLLRGPIRNG